MYLMMELQWRGKDYLENGGKEKKKKKGKNKEVLIANGEKLNVQDIDQELDDEPTEYDYVDSKDTSKYGKPLIMRTTNRLNMIMLILKTRANTVSH